MIRLAFYRAEGEWLDGLIRWWTGGPYSHVELVLGDPSLGEVTILSSSPRDGGVRERRLVLNLEHWRIVEIPGNEDFVAEFIRQRIGAKYDWFGVFFDHVLRLPLRSSARWYCSEIIAAALITAGARFLPSTRVHPNALFWQLTRIKAAAAA